MNRLDHVISDKHRVFALAGITRSFDQQTKTLDTPMTQDSQRPDGVGSGSGRRLCVESPVGCLNVRYGVNYQNTKAGRGSQGFDLTTAGFPAASDERDQHKEQLCRFDLPTDPDRWLGFH